MLDCFDLAVQTRTLDTRASPYVLAEFGYEPIPLETPEGRATYAKQQRDIATKAGPLRLCLRKILTSSKSETHNN